MHREDANPWVELVIVSGIGEARNTMIARTAQACIALPGSHGTLSEIAHCLNFGTPVAGLRCQGAGEVPYSDIMMLDDPDAACAWVASNLQTPAE
jgi:predicted Rossmann-fold nucleotide-binding protein